MHMKKGDRHHLPSAAGETAPAAGRGLQTNGACPLFLARARLLSRRWFFGDCGVGLAGIAAGALAARESVAGLAPPSPRDRLSPAAPAGR